MKSLGWILTTREWPWQLSIRWDSPLRSFWMVGNDAVEYQIVLLVLFKIIPETVNTYIRKSFFYIFCSGITKWIIFWNFMISHIFSCISSRMWFIISNLSLVLLPSVSTSRNFDLYSRLCEKNTIHEGFCYQHITCINWLWFRIASLLIY